MAYDIQINGSYSGRPNHSLHLYVRRSGTNGNSSDYAWELFATRDSGAVSWSYDKWNWAVNVGGHGYSGTAALGFSSGVNRITLASGITPYIGHDGNGYLNIGVDAWHNTGSVLGNADPAYAVLYTDRIARVPYAPINVSTSSRAATSFAVHYSHPGDDGGTGINQYEVQYATDPGFGNVVWNDYGSNGYSNPNGVGVVLANHTTYYVRVRARNAVGWGPYSGTVSTSTLGHPTVPTSVATVPSTSVTGRIQVNWNSPTTTGEGGIVGYNIFRDGVQIATTTGTGTGYADTGRTPYTTYAYTVAARNAYSNSISGVGPQSAAVNAVAPGPPGAPTSLQGASDGAVPGKVNLTWTAPAQTGAGGITGYRIRLADGTLIANQNGTGTSYSATGLTPGLSYTFKVSARNALSDTEGSEGAFSNEVAVTPIGEPQAPTNVTIDRSVNTSNRLVLSWTAPGGVLSGYNIFRRVNGADTLVGSVNQTHTSFAIDNLTPGTMYSYLVRARTIYTDTLAPGYPGNWGGPASAVVGATPTNDNTQTVISVAAITSVTNATFNGTYTISAITADTIRYAKVSSNIASASSGGSIANLTNAIFNGTFTIATPTPTTMTYSKTNANIGPLPTSGGTATDTTNAGFNGTFPVTAVNAGANLVSYANTAVDVTSRAVPNNTTGQSGWITNLSNAVFNGTNKVLTAITEYTMSYAQTNADVLESNAAGKVINATNRDVFNGTHIVTSIPAYNVVQYARTATTVALRTWINPNGIVSRSISPSLLDVRFRSGWSG